MKMYRTKSGEFIRTQIDAKANGEEFEKIDVPTDSQGLVDYLNSIRSAPAEKVDVNLEESESEYERGAIKTLSQLDDGTQTDEVVRLIMEAGRYTLGRYAMAVSLRFAKMEKKKK